MTDKMTDQDDNIEYFEKFGIAALNASKKGVEPLANTLDTTLPESMDKAESKARSTASRFSQWFKSAAEEIRLGLELAFESLGIISDQFFTNQQIKRENEFAEFEQKQNDEIARLESNRDQELRNEKLTADQKLNINQKYEEEINKVEQKISDKRIKLRIKQAKNEKAQALVNIAFNTAQAIISALAQVPKFDFGISAGAIAASYAAIGAIQAAAVISQPIPKFATGTERVKGSGTRTSDSVPAMLSIDERVVKANDNAKIGFNVSNDELVNGFLFYKDFLKGGSGGMSDKGIIKAMNENTKAVKQKPVPKISVIANPGTDINAKMYLS